MKNQVYYTDEFLQFFCNHLIQYSTNDCLGTAEDMLFLHDSSWMKETAVIDNVKKRADGWQVQMIFAHKYNPLTLVTCNYHKQHTQANAQKTALHLKQYLQASVDGPDAISELSFRLQLN